MDNAGNSRLYDRVAKGVAAKIADGEFVIGGADNLSGPSDLISLRARGKFYRPFTRVEEIRKQAEDKYLAEEKKLRDEKDAQDKEEREKARLARDKAGAVSGAKARALAKARRVVIVPPTVLLAAI